jgi:hypothetical protein
LITRRLAARGVDGLEGDRRGRRDDHYQQFDTAAYTGPQYGSLGLESANNQTVRNTQFNADGTFAVTGGNPRVKPQDAGYGAVNSAATLRTLQGQLRFSF